MLWNCLFYIILREEAPSTKRNQNSHSRPLRGPQPAAKRHLKTIPPSAKTRRCARYVLGLAGSTCKINLGGKHTGNCSQQQRLVRTCRQPYLEHVKKEYRRVLHAVHVQNFRRNSHHVRRRGSEAGNWRWLFFHRPRKGVGKIAKDLSSSTYDAYIRGHFGKNVSEIPASEYHGFYSAERWNMGRIRRRKMMGMYMTSQAFKVVIRAVRAVRADCSFASIVSVQISGKGKRTRRNERERERERLDSVGYVVLTFPHPGVERGRHFMCPPRASRNDAYLGNDSSSWPSATRPSSSCGIRSSSPLSCTAAPEDWSLSPPRIKRRGAASKRRNTNKVLPRGVHSLTGTTAAAAADLAASTIFSWFLDPRTKRVPRFPKQTPKCNYRTSVYVVVVQAAGCVNPVVLGTPYVPSWQKSTFCRKASHSLHPALRVLREVN